MACKDCALWDIDSARGPSGRLRPKAAARCRWVSTEPYPDSVSRWNSRPVAGYTEGNGGVNCKCFVKREG